MPEQARKDWLTDDRLDSVQSMSDRVASWFAWTTSNKVTLFKIVLALPMAFLFFTGHLVAGCVIYAIACLLDWVDGALARYHADRFPAIAPEIELRMTLRERMNIRGRSLLGKARDPLSDKTTYLGALIPLGLGWANTWLIGLSLLMAVALTIVRPIKSALGLGDGAANRFGKMKMWTEILVISAIVLLPHNIWLCRAGTNLLLGLALTLALLSFAGQLHTARRASTSPNA